MLPDISLLRRATAWHRKVSYASRERRGELAGRKSLWVSRAIYISGIFRPIYIKAHPRVTCSWDPLTGQRQTRHPELTFRAEYFFPSPASPSTVRQISLFIRASFLSRTGRIDKITCDETDYILSHEIR